MEHRTVELRNELRYYLRENTPKVVSGNYFADMDFRPKYPNDLVKITYLHFLTYSEDSREVRYVDEIFTNAEIVVDIPQFEADPKSEEWVDRIVNYSVRLELPDVKPTHEDVIQWERYQQGGEYTGRLVAADEIPIDGNIGPLPGIRCSVEFVLREMLPHHEGRSEERGLPLDFIENTTPEDWERIEEIRPGPYE